MKYLRTLLLIFFVCCISACSPYETNKPNYLVKDNMSAERQQVEILKAQLDEMRVANNNLIAVVNNTLVVCFAIFAIIITAILGLYWYINVNLFDRFTNQFKTKFDNDLKSKANEIDKDIRYYIDNDVRPQMAEIVKLISKKFAMVDDAIQDIHINNLFKIAIEQLSTKKYDNIINTSILIIKLAKSKKDNNNINNALGLMIFILQQMKNIPIKLPAEIEAVIKDLPPEFNTTLGIMRKLLSEKTLLKDEKEES